MALVEPSDQGQSIATDFRGLVEKTRVKIASEKQRVENEAAAETLTTSVVVLQTLEVLPTYRLDSRGKDVRMRDEFSLKMVHTTTQSFIEREVELILREKTIPSSKTSAKEVLVVQPFKGHGNVVKKTLLFPPFPLESLSCRLDINNAAALTVLYKTVGADGNEWTQAMRFTTQFHEAGMDWERALPADPDLPKVTFMDEKVEVVHPATETADVVVKVFDTKPDTAQGM